VLVLPLEVLALPVPVEPLLPATVVLLPAPLLFETVVLPRPLLPLLPLVLARAVPLLPAPVVPLPSPAVGAGAQAARVQPIAATKQRERVMAATSERP
jgi:hypothetical protein